MDLCIHVPSRAGQAGRELGDCINLLINLHCREEFSVLVGIF